MTLRRYIGGVLLVLFRLLVVEGRLAAGEDDESSVLVDGLMSSNEVKFRARMHQFNEGRLPCQAKCIEDLLAEGQEITFVELHPEDDFDDDMLQYAGIVSFAHLPVHQCFKNRSLEMDIAIVGAPYDSSVSYRPGARFGPNGIRQGSRRLGNGILPVRGFPGSRLRRLDPYNSGYTIVDCGDIPMTPFDNKVALNQLYRGERALHKHASLVHKDQGPRLITLGGDHTITLMALRAAYEKFGKLAVIHFDSHLDSWEPELVGGKISKRAAINHGSFLHFAHENGYLQDDKNIHVGIRGPYIAPGFYDEQHDNECGFDRIVARDFDLLSLKEIVSVIRERVGDGPIYISVDIDVLDPSVAPGTGTPEVGGLTPRELLTVLEGLEGLNIVGADIVEVAPAFDTNSDVTALIAAQIVDSLLGLMTVDSIEE